MAELRDEDFSAYFEALHGQPPFPWQAMLMERATEKGWPDAIRLPTAAGKTACMDVAVFLLALEANQATWDRSSARRIFFVVDRRIVVDEAYNRAKNIAGKLERADSGILRTVADRLRGLSAEGTPLLAARMRGGTRREMGWLRDPAQPAIITSTVDQLGSRLLFRAYGAGDLTASIHAGLTANDSLILLDEAHCAVPCMQTLRAVARFRGDDWAEQPIRTPFHFVVMSATPPPDVGEVFPNEAEQARALDHPVLRQRIAAVKCARLVVADKNPAGKKKDAGLHSAPIGNDPLLAHATHEAIRFAAAGRQRIAIMVNRVASARTIYRQLETETALRDQPLSADLVLMTGRMRLLDRDMLVDRWGKVFKAGEKPLELPRPVIVVTTQCLEVGADFSFDALITECASLDALRQRFGRLDRLGTIGDTESVILSRPTDVALDKKSFSPDPIYGEALARTWQWLSGHNVPIDMGIDGLERLLPVDDEQRRTLIETLSAPAPDAPVMLPAYLDCWAQTAPRPAPEPDVGLFLHGPARSAPEVSVVLRADLPDGADWKEIVSQFPPSPLEAFQVPLWAFQRWLTSGESVAAALNDVETTPAQHETQPRGSSLSPILVWKGREKSVVVTDAKQIPPYATIVLPTQALMDGVPTAFGHVAEASLLDLAEPAQQRYGRVILRIVPAVLQPWQGHPAVSALLRWARNPERGNDDEELKQILYGLAQAEAYTPPEESATVELPLWLKSAAHALSKRSMISPHPGGGYVLRVPGRLPAEVLAGEEAVADADDLTSVSTRAVTLLEHLTDVGEKARQCVRACLPDVLGSSVIRAAELHDLGKVDPRFQAMLHRGNLLLAASAPEPLAKSMTVPETRAARQRAREQAGLPAGFRHELLSSQLAEASDVLPVECEMRELVLHLIASHHGHARPFAPIVKDEAPPEVDLTIELANGAARTYLSAGDRIKLPPPHRLDSGVAERFWRLSRRYGWWGLAYLEALLRLADWAASEAEATPQAANKAEAA